MSTLSITGTKPTRCLHSADNVIPAHFTNPRVLDLFACRVLNPQDNPSQVVLTNEMEALSLSLSRLQVLFTLCPKCFSNFRSRYLFDIGLPTLYLTLADTYLPLDTALPSSATLFTERQ